MGVAWNIKWFLYSQIYVYNDICTLNLYHIGNINMFEIFIFLF